VTVRLACVVELEVGDVAPDSVQHGGVGGRSQAETDATHASGYGFAERVLAITFGVVLSIAFVVRKAI
jgi:hypothetical protein